MVESRVVRIRITRVTRAESPAGVSHSVSYCAASARAGNNARVETYAPPPPPSRCFVRRLFFISANRCLSRTRVSCLPLLSDRSIYMCVCLCITHIHIYMCMYVYMYVTICPSLYSYHKTTRTHTRIHKHIDPICPISLSIFDD